MRAIFSAFIRGSQMRPFYSSINAASLALCGGYQDHQGGPSIRAKTPSVAVTDDTDIYVVIYNTYIYMYGIALWVYIYIYTHTNTFTYTYTYTYTYAYTYTYTYIHIYIYIYNNIPI